MDATGNKSVVVWSNFDGSRVRHSTARGGERTDEWTDGRTDPSITESFPSDVLSLSVGCRLRARVHLVDWLDSRPAGRLAVCLPRRPVDCKAACRSIHWTAARVNGYGTLAMTSESVVEVERWFLAAFNERDRHLRGLLNLSCSRCSHLAPRPPPISVWPERSCRNGQTLLHFCDIPRDS